MVEEIEEKAQQILAQSPGAVVAFRLLRDVLQLPPEDSQLRAARKKLNGSIHIQVPTPTRKTAVGQQECAFPGFNFALHSTWPPIFGSR